MTKLQVRNKLRKAKTIALQNLGIKLSNTMQYQSKLGIRKTTVKLAAVTVLGVCASAAGSAQAAVTTLNSPSSGGALPSGTTPVGGIVLDLIGQNNNRVTSQLAASQAFVGFFAGNPGTIGTQTGFDASVIGALGGGIKEAAIRFTLEDGDTAPGNFDFNDNTLLVNGLNFGNWSDVDTVETDGLGNVISGGYQGKGFADNRLSTGFFFSNNAALLANLFDTLVNTQQAVYQVNDIDPGDNFYDFRQGVDGGLINVGQGPTVQPTPVPEPFTILGSIAAAGMGVALRLKSRLQQEEDTAA